MKIGIISTIENYEWAGTEEVWSQFAKIALQQGHEVHVSLHWRIAQAHQVILLQQQGLQVSVRRPFRPTRFYLLKERYWSDLQELQKFRPDILLINSGSLFDILNLPVLRQFCLISPVPKVFFCHFVAEGFFPHNRERVIEFIEMIHGWVFVSKHNRYLAERQLGFYFNNVQTIINGSRLILKNPLPLPTDNTVQLACVARLETLWKGQDVLLEVLSESQWSDRSWHLNLYGTGQDENYIKQLIDHYNLAERVTFHGYVRDIESVWRQNHLMVLASRGEGTPLAVLEAMMCGRPTVTTDAGGNREILNNYETGWIAEAATPYSFSRALESAWEHREYWPKIGQAAHQAAKQISEANPAQQLLDYLLSLYFLFH